MKKLMLILGLCLITTPSWALLDATAIQGQGQSQGQVANGGTGGNGGNGFGGSSFQAQGQSASQGNAQSSSTSIGGDENKVTTAVWPTTQSTSGKEEKSVYSLFGGIGNNQTEEYIRIQQQMQIAQKLLDLKIFSQAEYEVEIRELYIQLSKSNRAHKLLGVIPFAGRGCNIVNLCGLAAW